MTERVCRSPSLLPFRCARPSLRRDAHAIGTTWAYPSFCFQLSLLFSTFFLSLSLSFVPSLSHTHTAAHSNLRTTAHARRQRRKESSMGRKLSRLRAHKLAVKAEAQRANKREKKRKAQQAAPTDEIPVRSTKRGRHTGGQTSSAADGDQAAGALVKRILGTMALDTEDATLSSVRMAANSGDPPSRTGLKRQRSCEEAHTTVKSSRKKEASTRAAAASTSTRPFAIPLEGDADAHDEDLSHEVAVAASQFFARLAPNQQKNFWRLRDVAHGTAAAADKKTESSATASAESSPMGGTKQKKKKGKSTTVVDDDLSFGHLMTAAAASHNHSETHDDDDDEVDARLSSHSESSSEPSWILESDDEVEEEEEEEESANDYSDDDDDGESSEDAQREERRKPEPAQRPSRKGAATLPTKKPAKVAPPQGERVTVHRAHGRGGRLIDLDDGEDDTWDD